ncbi:hypothetical protein [Ferruginibacter sp.]
MKLLPLFTILCCSVALHAQRPATKAEKEEDARVIKILSAAMPHEMEGAEDPAERSFAGSDLSGVSGYYNDMNFATRDVFEHQYTISYQFTKAPEPLKEKVAAAQARNDLDYLMAVTSCDVQVYVNSSMPMPYSLTAMKKITRPYCSNIYRDTKETDGTFLFFGNNWNVKPTVTDGEGDNGKTQKRYSLNTKLNTHPGTDIQGILVYVKGHADIADLVMKQINWQSISDLIGTGKIKDDESESDLKKYFAEKPVTPVPGNNSLSFIYVDKDGKEKTFSLSSSKHDLTNCALLRNRNENPKIMQDANIDFRIQDDKDANRLFHMSLPIIRTTGKVTATYQSDYDYKIMWRGNTDPDHSFTAVSIDIKLTKWAAVGDFLEGTFSGTATINDHNDPSTEKPAFVIKNGKFRIRRIADQMR